MAVVRERDIPAAADTEILNALIAVPMGSRFSMPMTATFLPSSRSRGIQACREGEIDAFGAISLSDGRCIDFDGSLVRAVVPGAETRRPDGGGLTGDDTIRNRSQAASSSAD